MAPRPHTASREEIRAFVEMARVGNHQAMKAFLARYPEAIDGRESQHDWTALMVAAGWVGHKETVLFLLERGADIDIKSANGTTALSWAKYNKRKEIIQILTNEQKQRQRQTSEIKDADKKKKNLAVPKSSSEENFAAVIASGDCVKMREIFDQAFWRKEPVAVTWEHLKIALLREDRPMIRLLVNWGAPADQKNLLELQKETGKYVSYYMALLRQYEPQSLPPSSVKTDYETPSPIALQIPEEWQKVLEAFQASGAIEAVIAGGALRDLFNDRAVKDVDIFLQTLGSTGKNKAFLKKAFAETKLEITQQEYAESDSYGSFMALSHFPSPQKIKFLEDVKMESWKVIAGPEKTEYNIVFVPEEKKSGHFFQKRLEPPAINFAEKLIGAFDIGLCQIAFNGKKIIKTPAYDADAKNKQLSLVNYNPGTLEHLSRLKKKYPGWDVQEEPKTERFGRSVNWK